MAFKWKRFTLPRFYGLDKKTNVIDVKDGYSLDLDNVFQDSIGVISKRRGNQTLLANEIGDGSEPIREIGSATLSGTKYWFFFLDGEFHYATALNGAITTISPTPAIDTANEIWWSVIDDKVFFVDGTNALRFFDGTAILDSVIYERPTVIPAVAGAGAFTYGYTIDNGLGESPLVTSVLVSKPAGASATIQINTGPVTIVAGDRIRIYVKADAVAGGYVNATDVAAVDGDYYYVVTAGDVTATNAVIPTIASTLFDTRPQLYSELGIALNKTAPTGLVGIDIHYGRLVGWKQDVVYNSKVTNPHSWPDEQAVKEAFVYAVGVGDGTDITRCVSYRESLFVLKTNDAFVFGGIGPDDSGGNAYTYRRLETNGIGCLAGKSAVVVGDDKSTYLVYLSQQGFFASTGDRPIRIGEKIETDLIGLSDSNLQTAVGFHHKRDGQYICFIGGPTQRTAYVLDTREDEGELVGWFKWSGINASCVFYDKDRYIFGTYQGYLAQEKVSSTNLDYSDLSIEFVDSSDVDDTTDEITVTEIYETGQAVIFRTDGTVPTGLVNNTTYYAIYVSDTVIQLASSLSNALAGTEIDLSSPGTGTHTIISSVAISAFYTTNWFSYRAHNHVKKIGKTGLVFNASAPEINIDISVAYNWINVFEDPQTVIIQPNIAWGDLPWGEFDWGAGAVGSPRNIATARRKFRSHRFKFENGTINEDIDLQGIEIPFDLLRNRGNFGA